MTTLTRLDCGELTGDLGIFETDSQGQVTLSVNAWLVRHPRGTVLFDSGMPASFLNGSDRTRRISEFLTIGFDKDNTIKAQMESNSQDPDRVNFVVISHLHFDHVGGLSMVPNATLVIQRKEWEAGMEVTHDADTLHARKDYDLGHKLLLVDGEHDLFGDDSVVCIPTPGHTIGHQSLKIKLATGQQIVLASDCCYFARTLKSRTLPTFGHDLEEQQSSLEQLLKLHKNGVTIIPGHDKNFVNSIPRTLGINKKT
jgi:glyoxylase-like metal-dependent hydrolase (beta-lactamase superfamily II)